MIRSDTLLDRWTHELIVIRAGSRDGLIAAAERLSARISAACPRDLKDVAFTVNRSTDPGEVRLAVLASDADDLVAKLTHASRRLHDPACRKLQDRSGLFFFETALVHEGTLAFLFPGEGSQYPNMLLDLCLHFPEIRACFDVADAVFAANGRDPLPSQVVFPMPGAQASAGDRSSGLSDMDYAVATVFAAEQALLLLLRRLGLRPDAAVGHSSGEFAALGAAGALPIEDDGQLFATWRHLNGLHDLLLECVPKATLLTVAGVDGDTVASIVAQGHIHIAMDNCPHQLVLSGSEMDVRSVRDVLEGRGAICTVLPIARAYHTPSFQPACERLAEFYASLPVRPLGTTLYSCTTARRVDPNPEAVRCAAVEQWSRPVRFRETIETMYADGVRIFVEVGPRSNLTGFVSDILRGRPHLAVPLDVQQRPGLLQLQLALGRLAAHGVTMKLDYLYAGRAPRQLDFGECRAESAKAAEVMLSLELPRLSLSDSALPRSVRSTWSSPADTGRLPASAEYLDAAVGRRDPEQFRLCSDPAMMESEDASMSSGVRVANAPGDDGFPGSGGELRKADELLMDQYFQTMEQFLESQQAVMQAFMESVAPTVRPPEEDGRPVGPDVAGAVAPQRSPGPLPFRIVIASLLPGRSVSATCTLDVLEDLFLQHHTIGGPPSVCDAGVLALPVLPLAMALEIMAQATSLLVGDKHLVGARNVRIHQWVIMDKATRTLHVTARRSSSASVLEFEVEIADTAETGNASPSPQPVLAEGVLVFADGYPTPALADIAPLHGVHPYGLDPSEYYRRVMFHGPSFRSVLAVERSGEDGVDAIVKTQGGHALFEDATGVVPRTDPVLIDSAGQLVGFWVADRFDTNFVVFPLGFEELQLYGPWPVDPTIVHASARSRHSFDGRIYSEIQLVMEDGRQLCRLAGWEDKRFDFPRRLVDFWLTPCEVALSDPWNAAASRLPSDVFVRARCLNGSPNVLLGDGSDIWAQALARVVLSEQERGAWQALRHSPRRRGEWLAGRLVAKEACRELLRERYGIEAGPADITITPDPHGQPVVGGRAIERAGGRISVSIAHVPEFIVAIAGELDGRHGIGVDVQAIGSANDAVERGALTEEEVHLLAEMPPESRSEWVLRMWCAKEAVGKALGRGMAGTPLNVATRALDVEREDICLALAGSLAQSFPEHSDELLLARTGRDGEFVFATCLV